MIRSTTVDPEFLVVRGSIVSLEGSVRKSTDLAQRKEDRKPSFSPHERPPANLLGGVITLDILCHSCRVKVGIHWKPSFKPWVASYNVRRIPVGILSDCFCYTFLPKFLHFL